MKKVRDAFVRESIKRVSVCERSERERERERD